MTQRYNSMKKLMIKWLVVSSILVAPLTVMAQADSQYPASNFEPKVVFIDADAVKATKGTGSDTANLQAKQTEVDPQHPAAFFVPKVIFP